MAVWSFRCAPAVRSADGMNAGPSRWTWKKLSELASAWAYTFCPLSILKLGEDAAIGPVTAIV